MEYSQTYQNENKNYFFSLNPYSNGILTDLRYTTQLKPLQRLNPYSNGILTDDVRKVIRLLQLGS